MRRRERTYRRAVFEALESRMVLTAPTLAAIPEVTMYAGVPMYVALDGYDADGNTLSFSATTTNSRLTTAIPTGNRSMKITVADYGTMTFQLFEDMAPRPTERIIDLAEGNFYDGLKFHRILKNFVTQGGDPTGTGSGSSSLGDFDDQYNSDLRHSTAGVLSMAKSSQDDTNDCQFYITNAATPDLDMRYSAFGFLTEGESVRQAIASVDVTTNPSGEQSLPLEDVVMNSVSIFVDQENGVLVLKTDSSFVGSAYVTVVASDGQGGTAEQTFRVNVLAPAGSYASSAYNPPPFLSDIEPIVIRAGQSYNFTIPAQDANGDAIFYSAQMATGASLLQVNTSANTGQTVLTADATAAGVYSLRLRVASSAGYLSLDSSYSYYHDTQYVPVYVLPQAPTVDLLDSSDTGVSQSDNVTGLDNTPGKTLQFRVSGVDPDSIVSLYVDGNTTPIGQGEAYGTEVIIETNGSFTLSEGVHQFRAVQTLADQAVAVGNLQDTVDLASDPSAPLAVTVGLDVPQFTSNPPLTAFPGVAYLYDAQTNLEASGNVRYSLTKSVTGMTVNENTGQFTWTPTADQVGVHEIILRAANLLGDEVEQTFQVNVVEVPEIAPIADQSVHEGQSVSFTVEAEGDYLPLSFSLENAPQGAAIDAQTGAFTWTTSESDGPGEYHITVAVANTAGAISRQTFTVNVSEDNTPPQLTPIGNCTILEGELFQFQAIATDADLPANALSFRLADGAPAGAQIDAQTGQFCWTPSEAQGPGEYQITVIVSDSANTTANSTFTITVQDVQSPPAFSPIEAQTAQAGQQIHLVVRAADTDLPGPNPIVYSLESGTPAGATINAQTGELAWAVPQGFPSGPVNLVVRATEIDSEGQPGASGTLSIRVNIESSPTPATDLEWLSFAAPAEPLALAAERVAMDWVELLSNIASGGRIGTRSGVSGSYEGFDLLGPRLAARGAGNGVRQTVQTLDRIDSPEKASEGNSEEAPADNAPALDTIRQSSWSNPEITDVVLEALDEDGDFSTPESAPAETTEAEPQQPEAARV